MAAERPVASVLGLGTTGGSFATALRQSGRYGAVVGWDPDFDQARAAQRAKVADKFVNNAPEAARQAAVVYLALQGEPFRETMTAIGPNLRAGAIVCSLAEAHETAIELADKTLPRNVSFVCARPVPWEEASGDPPAAAFRKGVLCITPTAAAHHDAVAYLSQVGEELGMQPFFVDAREHDAFAAGLDHLPALLAAALMRVASREPSWRELSRLAGADFRHFTGLAGVRPEDHQLRFQGSREHLVRWLDTLVAELRSVRDGLADGREPEDYFEGAFRARAKWLAERDIPAQAAELPGGPEAPRRRFPF